MRPILLLLLFALPPSYADYSRHPKAAGLIEELVSAHGFEREALLTTLRNAQKVPKLIEAERKSAEKTLSWPEYRAIFLRDWRIEGGVDYLEAHAAIFSAVEARTGVPPHIIAAITGVETRYGGYTGPHRVLDSLATQGFDHPTRQKFFFNEFKEFLLACREHGMDPLQVKGSYAGAMGLVQFMPSNYRRLALDHDGDGRVDLWSPPDAIASAANYLVNYRGKGRGWVAGAPVAVAARPMALPSGLRTNTKKAPYTVARLIAAGLQPAPGLALPAPDTPAGIVRLETESGPALWFVFDNFYNLMAYNPRTYYAMAVYQLALAIRDAKDA